MGKQEAFYVGVRNGSQRGLLAGPFPTAAEADSMLDMVRREAERVDRMAHFYTFTTERIAGVNLPAGRLNTRLGLAS